MKPIPHIIHYCWFGHKPLPPLSRKCIDSWRQHFPDYEIKEWTEENLDVTTVPYVAEAYRAGKYAFVSDYFRFWLLYNEGGVYFDTDVEVIRSFDDLLACGPFMGGEFPRDGSVKGYLGHTLEWTLNPGLGMAAEQGNPFLKEMLDDYDQMHFINPDGSMNLKVIGEYTTEHLLQHGLEPQKGNQTVVGFNLYTSEYLCPVKDNRGRWVTTENTHSIHHFAGTWLTPGKRLKNWVMRDLLPTGMARCVFKIKRQITRNNHLG